MTFFLFLQFLKKKGFDMFCKLKKNESIELTGDFSFSAQ